MIRIKQIKVNILNDNIDNIKKKVNSFFNELTLFFYLTQALTNFKKDSASKEAPPTKPPSMFSLLINSSILLGFTDPPYNTLTSSATALPNISLITLLTKPQV
mgnify:CR=1 FL=1